MLGYGDLVGAVEREAQSIAVALRSGPSDAPVPTCPAWDVRTLARHLGEFTALWTHVVCEATGRDKTPYEADPPGDGAALGDWYETLAGHLVATLRATDADQPAWTWVPSQQRVGFIARRCANELAVHRVDAESARGTSAPIDADLAASCILEIPDLLEGWEQDSDYRHEGSGRRLHLCPTDSDHELVLTMASGRLDITSEHCDDADLTLRGATSDLTLVAFDRPPLGVVDRTGDPAVLAAWYREFHFG